MNRVTISSRMAFTLIELLAVIAIIGVLMGILVPTISGVINTSKKGTLKIEVDELAKAVERYRDKYGDYPPDGSDWPTFERHIRKAFPQILATELALVSPLTTLPSGSPYHLRNSCDTLVITGNGYVGTEIKVMDAPEALVFFLGGFSSDPKRPFTGRGGPFMAYTGPGASAGQLHYNVSRENAFFEFEAGRLTLSTGASGGAAAPVVSTDEELFHGGLSDLGNLPDLLPVYLSKHTAIEESAPYVYFDSRTYTCRKKNGPYFNFYQRSPIALLDPSDLEKYGAIYPFFSDVNNSANKVLPGVTATNATIFALFQAKQPMEPTKFQIIGPGLDGKYGGRLIGEVRKGITPGDLPNNAAYATSLSETVFIFPNGNSIAALNTNNPPNQPFRVVPEQGMLPSNVDPRFIVRVLDNTASFGGATLDAGSP